MEDYSIKSIRQEFKSKGVFYTPPELGKYIKSIIEDDFKDKGYNEIYDPTCGRGYLLSVFPDEVRKYGQEIDSSAVTDASTFLKNCDIRLGDTITEDKFTDNKFKVIIANPPFSIPYNPTKELEEDERFKYAPCLAPKSKADYMFILHCLHHLTDDGRAYILNFPGILYRGQREGKIRRWLIEQNVIDKIYLIPGNTFTDTSIPTVLVVLRKDRNSDTIFMQDNTNGLNRNVPVKEIAENDYSLSVTSYIIPEPEEKEHFDPWQAEENARENMYKHLKAELEFSLLISRIQGIDFTPCLTKILDIVGEFSIKYRDYLLTNPKREPELSREMWEQFTKLDR